MTKKEVIRKHRKMWRWLVLHPKKSKKDYLKIFDPKTKLVCDCYLCNYTSCDKCYLKWPGNECCGGGLYNQWLIAKKDKKYFKAAWIALKIAILPEAKSDNI